MTVEEYNNLKLNDIIKFKDIPESITTKNIYVKLLNNTQVTITKISRYKTLHAYGVDGSIILNFNVLGVLQYMTKKESLNTIAAKWWCNMTEDQRYIQMQFYKEALKRNRLLVNTRIKKIVFMYLGGISNKE